MVELDRMPQHTEKDAKAMARYGDHEKGLDSEVIQFAFEGHAIVKTFYDYHDIAENLLKGLNVTVNNNKLVPPEDRAAWFIKTSHNDEIWDRLKKNGARVVDIKGREHLVIPNAHSSDHSIYFFGSILDRSRDIAHEIGVMCGLPVIEVRGGRPINDMDLRYERFEAAEKIKDGSGIEANEPVTYTLANLDTNLATRDYAAGAGSDMARRMEDAWPWKTAGAEFDDPFSREALAYYSEALPAAEFIAMIQERINTRSADL